MLHKPAKFEMFWMTLSVIFKKWATLGNGPSSDTLPYSTHAVVFTCQKLAFAHRRSATILSRTKELDRIYLDKMRNRLASFGVDPYDLSIISQSECPTHKNGSEGVNINIDPETFSSHNIGQAVRKTGSAIADGVEYVVEAGKTVYHKVASSKEDLTESPAGRSHSLKDDAEWLP